MSYLKRLIITVIFILVIFFSLPFTVAHEHSHSHGHSHEEPPSFKWSKEANVAYSPENEESLENHHHVGQGSPMPKSTPQINRQSDPNLWFEAMGATLLISIAPYLILFIIPVTNSKEHEPYLKVLLAFASGGLLGDAFLHLIPHALMAKGPEDEHSHSHSHSHSHAHSHSHLESGSENLDAHSHDTTIGISVLAGIIVFLIVEKFVRIFKGGHSHSHNLSNFEEEKVSKQVKDDMPKNKNDQHKSKDKSKNEEKESKDNVPLPQIKTNFNEGNMKVAGYLNLAADFTHNFTDGLAIGASFLAGKSVGIVTTLTIFLHEIPHEIGDFAILLQSGCSKRKAMLLQLITALGALTGTWVSLMAEGTGDSTVSWILPFTAGGFIYIATVSVIPELLENSHFWQSVAEVAALLLGVALMVVITWLEDLGHT